MEDRFGGKRDYPNDAGGLPRALVVILTASSRLIRPSVCNLLESLPPPSSYGFEVGRLDVREPDLERRVNDAVRQASDDELYHRLNQAEIVVSGVAIDTFPYEPHTGEKPHVSEHDPEWWACLIEVKTVEKGKVKEVKKGEAAAREIVTLFAHSIDIVWYHSPKFEKGSTGIWLMHSKDFRGNPVPGLVTDHPLDFQPISQLDHIRALVRRAQQ